jgi:uncharacterized membrane protein
MSELTQTLIVIAVLASSMVVGTLFAFSVFIMNALSGLEKSEGIRAMQRMNQTVYTPWFMVPFSSTTLVSIGAVVSSLIGADQNSRTALLCAGTIYLLGVFGITALGNVPMNKRLSAMNADDPATHHYWDHYLSRWTRLNHARVALGVLSIAITISAI